MNAVNRVVIIILLLIVIVVASVTLVAPLWALNAAGMALLTLGYRLQFASQPWIRTILGLVLALVIDAVALFLIYLEVRPRRKRYIRVQQVSGGLATLSVESIVQQLQYRLDPLPGVRKARPAIRAKGERVEAVVDVSITPERNVPGVADELVKAVREALTVDLGLQVAKDPEIRLHVMGVPESRPVTPAPAAPAPTTSAPAPEPLPEPAPLPPAPLEPVSSRHDWAGLEPEKQEPRA